MFLGFGDKLTYKYSASYSEKLKLRPNHLMLWSAIQEGIKRRIQDSLISAEQKGDNEGLRKFKGGMGSD